MARYIKTVAPELLIKANRKAIVDHEKYGSADPVVSVVMARMMTQGCDNAVTSDDGVRVAPRYIRKVADYDGHVLEEDYPEVRDVINARTARRSSEFAHHVYGANPRTATRSAPTR